ncbi:MAG: redox-regulated ATPase YchF [Patescibacteria group bacterium]|nr:redox-regulated ATPase YchF [Patescibacteria group bacterium]
MLKIGIVGLPNVGKSTLFNTLTKTKAAQAANYPFCTIEPNVGIVNVPDSRIDNLSRIVQPERTVPAAIEFVDIAGLVKGASEGEGLGNKFLANIRECDAIVQVVRIFEDGNIHHVHGQVDPGSDIEIINTELILADVDSLSRQKSNWEKKAKSGDKEAKAAISVIEKTLLILESGQLANTVELTEDEAQISKIFHLLTQKPFIYAANVHEDQLADTENPLSKHITNNPVVRVCAKLEEDLLDMEEEEQKEYLESLGVEESGLNALIRAAYDILGLQSYFTAGVTEVRAWTIHKGDTAPNAAGVIHTDFEDKFIRAEVISVKDFIANDGWKGCKEAGVARTEGKDYIVQDGDIMNFLHGA